MPQVVAFEDARIGRYRHKGCAFNTPLLESSSDSPDSPVALLTEGDVSRHIKPHWHMVDQFQVIVSGNGTLGRHKISPYCVHFARAYTPYGPVVDDGKSGVGFLTLRAHFDPGPNYVPASRNKLKQIPDRRPWQISRKAEFPVLSDATAAEGVALREIPDMKDERGLFAYSITMAPKVRTTAPDPAGGDGQYLVIVKGGMWYAGKEHKCFTIVFIEPHERPFDLHAGRAGLEALILNFPRPATRGADDTARKADAAAGFDKWHCEFCNFVYDEAIGLPHDGIPAGTAWTKVPEDWTCPDCSTSKSDFKMFKSQ
jgi:rubredoxin